MRLIKDKTFYNKSWYGSYRAMIDRCQRESAKNYCFYGGRGIKVCDEWHDIEIFEKWAQESGYAKGLSLDRIDPNGDYCPNNCRWATPKEQANNRRNTVYIEWNGERHTLADWADICGVNHSTFKNRYYRGWSIEKMLTRRDYNVSFN